MNKSEKLICIVLGLVLAFYIFNSMRDAKKAREAAAEQALAAQTAAPAPLPARPAEAKPVENAPKASVSVPNVPEKTVVLENGELKLTLSSWGAVVKNATLKEYARNRGAVSESNPALVFDYSSAPLGALEGVAGLAANAAYEVRTLTHLHAPAGLPGRTRGNVPHRPGGPHHAVARVHGDGREQERFAFRRQLGDGRQGRGGRAP